MQYMLYYTNQIFSDSIIDDYLLMLCDNRDDELINNYGLCAKERKRWQIDFRQRLNNYEIWNYISESMTEYDKIKMDLKVSNFS